MPATPTAPPFSARTRRTKSHWEPIFEPNCAEEFPKADWADVVGHGATTRTLDATDLAEALKNGLPPKFSNISFKNCDFFGYFSEIERTLVFTKCDFDFCDFGLSTWQRAKFKDCKFRHTTLTQCTLTECEFRGCTWESIGLSGNETRLRECYVQNPCDLVESRFVNLNQTHLKRNTTTRGEELRIQG